MRRLPVVFASAALGGALAGIAVARAARAEMRRAAVADERRRIARELHDGAAQEIAFAAGQTKMAAHATGEAAADLAARACERALAETRASISDLRRPGEEPLCAALARTAREAAAGRAEISLDVPRGLSLDPERRHELLRIVREAVANAARHAEAQTICVSAENGRGTSLRVADDGAGFDLAEAEKRLDRFGLAGMRERAEALGGRLEIETAPGAGTKVELWIP